MPGSKVDLLTLVSGLSSVANAGLEEFKAASASFGPEILRSHAQMQIFGSICAVLYMSMMMQDDRRRHNESLDLVTVTVPPKRVCLPYCSDSSASSS